MVIYKHSLYTFELIEGATILLFNWTKATENMTEEDFQEALHNYAGFGCEYQVSKMLIDVRNFRYKMTPQLGIWRDEHISPRYAKFGLQKFAYIVPLGVLEGMKDTVKKVARSFEEQYFESAEDALNWLTN